MFNCQVLIRDLEGRGCSTPVPFPSKAIWDWRATTRYSSTSPSWASPDFITRYQQQIEHHSVIPRRTILIIYWGKTWEEKCLKGSESFSKVRQHRSQVTSKWMRLCLLFGVSIPLSLYCVHFHCRGPQWQISSGLQRAGVAGMPRMHSHICSHLVPPIWRDVILFVW